MWSTTLLVAAKEDTIGIAVMAAAETVPAISSFFILLLFVCFYINCICINIFILW